MCGFDGIQRGNYFGREVIRSEVDVRVRTLKNGKAAGKDEASEKMVKAGGDMWWDGFGGRSIWPLKVV